MLIFSEKINGMLFENYSGLKTRMTCSKSAYGMIFFGTQFGRDLDMVS